MSTSAKKKAEGGPKAITDPVILQALARQLLFGRDRPLPEPATGVKSGKTGASKREVAEKEVRRETVQQPTQPPPQSAPQPKATPELPAAQKEARPEGREKGGAQLDFPPLPVQDLGDKVLTVSVDPWTEEMESEEKDKESFAIFYIDDYLYVNYATQTTAYGEVAALCRGVDEKKYKGFLCTANKISLKPSDKAIAGKHSTYGGKEREVYLLNEPLRFSFYHDLRAAYDETKDLRNWPPDVDKHSCIGPDATCIDGVRRLLEESKSGPKLTRLRVSYTIQPGFTLYFLSIDGVNDVYYVYAVPSRGEPIGFVLDENTIENMSSQDVIKVFKRIVDRIIGKCGGNAACIEERKRLLQRVLEIVLKEYIPISPCNAIQLFRELFGVTPRGFYC